MLASAIAALGCKQPAPPAMAAPAVTVAKPLQEKVTEWDEYTGRLEAVELVQVRARVSGYLQSISFTDGQIVRKGTRLFVIDPRPYEAVRNRALAEVQQAEARLELARSNLARGEALLQTDAIAVEDAERRRTDQQQAEAGLQAAKAALEEATLNLEFTQVVAPVTGRIDRHYVSEGNLVNGGAADATLLTTIVSLDPIYAYFETDERAYLKYTRPTPGTKDARLDPRNVRSPVELGLADEDGFPHKGRLDFIENRIDAGTATIRARALLPNPDLTLTPGLFARVRLVGGGRKSAILIPDAAVGSDQAQKFVYIVNSKNEVEYRAITLGPRIDGLRVVRGGLTSGERIVTSGLQRVRPGAQVQPKEELVVRREGTPIL